MNAVPPHAPPVRMGGSVHPQVEIVRSMVDQVRNWARSAAIEHLDRVAAPDADWPITVDVGMFIGHYPDADPEAGQALPAWSSAIGIYLDIPGVDPLPEQRIYGTVMVQPWGATEELVTGLVTDALTRFYRDRATLSAEARRRQDDLDRS